jgi:ribA/ribD-fused uncharacterized protein
MTLPTSISDLTSRFNAGETFSFLYFWGHRPRPDGVVSSSCFSQWYPAPFHQDGVTYPTAEHYMMAEKARLFGDTATAQRILRTPVPGAAKALGREVQGFVESTWNAHRFDIVVRGNMAKFSQNPSLGQFLSITGNKILVEASPVDSIWGIGLPANDARAKDPNTWQGLNLLGFALNEVRDQLRDRAA